MTALQGKFVRRVKSMISQIINKANSPYPPDSGHMSEGQYVAEVMIPGPKVGLLIGKGGENIKNLQEKGCVKMVLIQDGPQQTAHEKPLRISGEPQKVEFAKQMVMDLLAQKDVERFSSNNNNNGSAQEEILVPRQAVGVVIGKSGDMIKSIQADSGARVQFVQGKEDVPGDKLCQITGGMDQVQKATCIIQELIQSVLMSGNDGGGGGGGRGRGRGRGRGGMGGPGMRPDYGPGGPRMRGGPHGGAECQFMVPSNKCGLVIGKGGETIRNINQQSGAHVEIARGEPANSAEKLFIVRGSPQQIEHAKQLISERVGMPIGNPGPGGPQGGQGGPPGPFPGPQYQQHFQQPGPSQQYGAPWGGNPYQQWQGQPGAGVQVTTNDPAKAAADANAAAWAAYYAQLYSQPGQPQPAQMQPAPAAGQAPDYSAAWVEYYRSMGMYREAEVIEQQARSNQAQGGQPSAGAPAGIPAGVPAQQQQPGAQPAPAGTPGVYSQPGQQPAPGQVPYAAASPYPGYSYAAYGGQQQFQPPGQ